MAESKNKPNVMQILTQLRNGNLVAELSEQIAELAQIVKETRQGAKLSLTLSLKPGQGSHKAVIFMDDVKVTKPKKKAGETLFFSDDDGAISRNDPDQLELQGITVVRSEGKPTHDVKRMASGE